MEKACRTTVNGTNDVSYITAVIAARTGTEYSCFYIRNSVPTQAQKDTFWKQALATVSQTRRGMPVNIRAPANNHPPGYPNELIMHYVTVVGVDTDNRRVYVSDSARFSGIEHYWISADRLCTMITPKGYGSLSAPKPVDFWDAFTPAERVELGLNFRQLGPS